jgi:hypothetical protein
MTPISLRFIRQNIEPDPSLVCLTNRHPPLLLMKLPFLLILIATACLITGCQSVDHRIKENQALFDRLDPLIQSRIKQGLIAVGDTPDMVYIALGKPSEVKETTTASGKETTWIYLNYWQEYQGTQIVGHRRIVYFDAKANAYRVYFEPIEQSIYTEHVQDKTRVYFKDGKVSALEQSKN